MSQGAAPFFSFVIPVYNCAEFLPRAAGSILSNPSEDFELILVDDGSSDGSSEQIRQLQLDSRVRALQQANSGPGAARNHGVREAQGEYVWFLDCDDELLPEALHLARNYLMQKPDTDMLVGGHIKREINGSERVRTTKPLGLDNSSNFVQFIRKQLGSFSHGSVVVRRTVFDNLEYPEGIRNNEDLVLHALILALYNCSSIPDPLVRIYGLPNSLRHNIDSILESSVHITSILFDHKLLPTKLLRYRREFNLGRKLSLFRSLYNAGRLREARQLYLYILRQYPAAIIRWSYLKKFIRSVLRCL